jgi:hypothetical protein
MLACGFANENLNMMIDIFSSECFACGEPVGLPAKEPALNNARNQPRPPPHLVVITDLGSFAEAARQLNLAPPTISLHVAELEARIGAPLLTRTRGQVRPTAIGETLLLACPPPAGGRRRWTKYAGRSKG